MLSVVQGDVLSSQADAILIPVDGTFVPQAGQVERLLGNVGRQFLRRFPEAELLEEVEAQVDLPLPRGSACMLELSVGPFRCAILVSTLHHVESLDDRAKRALVRASFGAAIRVAVGAGRTSPTTAVLQGAGG